MERLFLGSLVKGSTDLKIYREKKIMKHGGTGLKSQFNMIASL